jgi:hypothetical protein
VVLCNVNMFLICKFSSSVLTNLTSGVCRLIIFLGGSLELMRFTNGPMVLEELRKNGLKQRFRLFQGKFLFDL